METNDLYRMIEALLASGNSTAGAAPSPLEDLVRAAPAPAPVVQTATTTKTKATQASSPGVGETIANTLLGGIPLYSLFKGLFSLAGGDDEETLPPLVKYQLPAAVNESAGYSARTGFVPLDYDQTGSARTPSAAAPQVTVQVNAMDSRSFLDHSDEIASAVREAVLNSHSLRDVLTEL
jgi:hypothetical protein